MALCCWNRSFPLKLESGFWLALMSSGLSLDVPPLVVMMRALERELIGPWAMVAWACVRVGWVAVEAELEVETSGGAPDFALACESTGVLSLRRATWRATVGDVDERASLLLSLLCELPIPAGESVGQPILGVETAAFAKSCWQRILQH